MEALALLLFVLSHIPEGIMDTLQFRIDNSIFKNWNQQFWNPEFSWMNKWKDGCPKFGPRFFGSTTFLVFLTDGWHLMKWTRNRFIDGSILVFLLGSLDFLLALIITILVSSLGKALFEFLFTKIFSS